MVKILPKGDEGVDVYILWGPGRNERLVVISEEPLSQDVVDNLRHGPVLSTLIGLDITLDVEVEDQIMPTLEGINGVDICSEATSSYKIVGNDGTNWDQVFEDMQTGLSGIFEVEYDDVRVHLLLAA